jgi:ATP phosphoribosyltransferase regulatory subunit
MNPNQNRWLLPEGLEELLPPRARQLELAQRRLLDLFNCWGYEQVMTPFVEFVESLLVATASDLDHQTFKLTDPLSGRLMGIRTDMTPQVARIDAHLLKRNQPVRLCYAGTVLQTQPRFHGGSRSPLQVGAELFGHAGSASDHEILDLMIAALAAIDVRGYHLDLGHVGIYRAVIAAAGISPEQESIYFDALQRKSCPEIEQWLTQSQLPPATADLLRRLPSLHGDLSLIAEARQQLAAIPAAIVALNELEAAAKRLAANGCNAIHLDLAELRGYHYHTGLVFAAYLRGMGQAVAMGGRYDGVGSAFGRERAATGFSIELRTLLAWQTRANDSHVAGGIVAPASNDPALLATIAALRQQGERVICQLPGAETEPHALGCDRQLIPGRDGWQLQAVTP